MIAALEIFSAPRGGDIVNWGVQRPGIGFRIVSTCYRWHWPVMLSLGED